MKSPPSPTSTPTTVPGLSEGRLARLSRGINLAFWFWYGPENPDEIRSRFKDREFNNLRKMGFTHVRLPVDPYLLLNPDDPSRPNPVRLAQLDEALDRLLTADLAAIIDLHNLVPDSEGLELGQRLERSDEFVEIYATFLQNLAAHLSRRDQGMVFLEILNEPVFQSNPYRWVKIQPRLLAAARRGAPDLTLIASGPLWTGIDGLLKVTPVDDSNIVYNFHFYEPFPFTHQGATWAGKDVINLRSIPYPSSPEAVEEPISLLPNERDRLYVRNYGNQHWNAAEIRERIALVAGWAKLYNVRVTCNEFGTYSTYAPPDDRVTWIQDVRSALEANGIGWAMWEYDNDFGLVVRAGDQIHVNEEVARALGVSPEP